jgi:penicillin-binding protein 2
MTHYAAAFGFGQPTGIDLSGEKLGFIPQPRAARRGRRTFLAGDVANMAIGQGSLLATPMQIARFMSSVANGGVLWKPRLVQRVERPERGVIWSDPGKVMGHVELSPMVWAVVRQGLWGVVNEGGTGAAARIPGLDIAGKTGTAQTIANSKSEKGQDHAWFAAYAPAQNPEVVVVVFVERGGHGGAVAAPIARQILDAIFFEKVAMAGFSES